MAISKHYILNNQETDRSGVNEIVDEKTIMELYVWAPSLALSGWRVLSVLTSASTHHVCRVNVCSFVIAWCDPPGWYAPPPRRRADVHTVSTLPSRLPCEAHAHASPTCNHCRAGTPRPLAPPLPSPPGTPSRKRAVIFSGGGIFLDFVRLTTRTPRPMGVHRTCGEPDEIELTPHGGEIERLATGTCARTTGSMAFGRARTR